jgi:hypothetical protein
MPTPSAIPITLRLIRKDKTANKDDIIKIHTYSDVDSVEYMIEYVDPESSTKSGTVHHSSEWMSGDEIDTYLDSLFTLLTRDDDPFDKFQIAAPGFPCILLKVEELKKARVREAIRDVLPVLTKFWKA